MNILHYFKTYYPESKGGIEQVIYQLSEGTKSHGVNSTVLALGPASAVFNYGHHTVYTAQRNLNIASTGFSLEAISLFSRLAARADIIHYHYPWPFMDLTHLVTRPKQPFLVTYHSDIVKQANLLKLYTPLQNWFLDRTTHIVATSPQYVSSSATLQKYREKVQIIPLGLGDSSQRLPDAEKLAQLSKTLPERFLLFIGTLRYYKGLDYLLEAARSFPYPVVIVGAGPEEQKLQEYKLKHGLDHVIFLGQRTEEEKQILLRLCHSLVMPSHLRSEAYGLSLVEGAMFGKPVISCDIGTGTSYVNCDPDLICLPANSQALATKVHEVFNLSATDYAQKSDAIRAHYLENLTQDRMVDSYTQLYQNML